MRTRQFLAALATVAPLLWVHPLLAQSPAEDVGRAAGSKIREALGDDAAEFWIYEDVEAGIAESRRTGKPLLVSIR